MKICQPFTAFTAFAIACGAMLCTPVAAQQSNHFSDAQIASIAVTANKIDIKYGEIAKEKSQNADVRNFAETMIRDHQGVIDQAVALVTRLGVTPEDNSTSKKLLSDAAKINRRLNAKNGAAFDKAYINNEVAYHKAVIGTVENALIPQSQNAELKGLLQSVLPVLKAHLQHAEMVQKKISK
jgi:putative membrane protein